MNNKNLILPPPIFRNYVWKIALMVWCCTVPFEKMYAQLTPCDTPDPTPEQSAQLRAMVDALPNSFGAPPVVRQVPVRFIVCYKGDGTGFNIAVDNAYVDAFLASMNAKINVGTNPNTFNFFRCGEIVNLYDDQLYSGTVIPADYSYARNLLNIYINGKQGASDASQANSIPPNIVNIRGGPGTLTSWIGHHEVGHTLGLRHTFGGSQTFNADIVNSPNYVDHPYNVGPLAEPRELVIRSNDEDLGSIRKFKTFNYDLASDRLKDTPSACHTFTDASKYPSMASFSSGCFDGDNNTPCINYCADNNPATPCTLGCAFDLTNCKYTGTAVDYNFDLLTDPGDVMVKNYMSYGPCGQQFTSDQHNVADNNFAAFLDEYYQEAACNFLINDRVEIEGTAMGVNNVNIWLEPLNQFDLSRTVTNNDGGFNLKLGNNDDPVELTANVRKYPTGDIAAHDDDWKSFISTFDIIPIRRHILGITPLNGYRQLAADVNRDFIIDTNDTRTITQLVLGRIASFPMYDHPWRFIPEFMTQSGNAGGQLQKDFNGGGNFTTIPIDNPFSTQVPVLGGPFHNPDDYCGKDWEFNMGFELGVKNGFDAIKLGNVSGSYIPGLQGECPGEVAMVVPNIEVGKEDLVELNMKGFNFTNVDAFQMGIKVSGEDFEFVEETKSPVLNTSTQEGIFGGLNQGKDNLRVMWISDDYANPKSIPSGGSLFTIKLKAKKGISNLSEAITLDDKVLETYFLSPDATCKTNTSLQITATVTPSFGSGTGNRSASTETLDSIQKIFGIPNPASDNFTLLFDAEKEFEGAIHFYDMYGKLLKRTVYQFESGRNVISIQDFDQFPTGVLNCSIIDRRQNHSLRIVKH